MEADSPSLPLLSQPWSEWHGEATVLEEDKEKMTLGWGDVAEVCHAAGGLMRGCLQCIEAEPTLKLDPLSM